MSKPTYHVHKAYLKKKTEDGITSVLVVIGSKKRRKIDSIVASNLKPKESKKAMCKEVFPKRYKDYKRIELEPLLIANSKQEATVKIIELRRADSTLQRFSRIHGDDKENCAVYAFKLNPEVWQNKKFIQAQEHTFNAQAFYVGQTALDIRKRFEQHVSDNSKTSSMWGKRYFDQTISEGISPLILALMGAYKKQTGIDLRLRMLQSESIYHEYKFTQFLRSEGYGAYSS